MYPILVGIIVFGIGVFGACPSIYWRDAGEFVLTGLFRDIPHQPGSPLYGTTSTFFSLFPGPLAWRINLFSVLCGSLFCFQLSLFILRLFPKHRSLCLLPLLCLSSNGFIRQLCTAEVYLLYALINLLLAHLIVSFFSSRDCRYLYAFGFVSGIGIGSHIALIISSSLLFLVTIPRTNIKSSIITFLFGLFGLAIFAYLPLRAAQNPPLNSGTIESPSTFLNFVTNARDRELRGQSSCLPR